MLKVHMLGQKGFEICSSLCEVPMLLCQTESLETVRDADVGHGEA